MKKIVYFGIETAISKWLFYLKSQLLDLICHFKANKITDFLIKSKINDQAIYSVEYIWCKMKTVIITCVLFVIISVSGDPESNSDSQQDITNELKVIFTNLLSLLEGSMKLDSKTSKEIKEIYDVDAAIYYGKVDLFKNKVVVMLSLIEWIDKGSYLIFDSNIYNQLDLVRSDLFGAKLVMEKMLKSINNDLKLTETIISENSKSNVDLHLKDILNSEEYSNIINKAIKKLRIIINSFGM